MNPKKGTKVRPRTAFSRKIENFINSFRTFKKYEINKFSDEWFVEEMTKVNPQGTICESHRKMFKELKKSYIMAKKITDKLIEYKERM